MEQERPLEVVSSRNADCRYEAPRIVLVGNLRDILAGTGSGDTDIAQQCPGTGTLHTGCGG